MIAKLIIAIKQLLLYWAYLLIVFSVGMFLVNLIVFPLVLYIYTRRIQIFQDAEIIQNSIEFTAISAFIVGIIIFIKQDIIGNYE